MTKKSTIQHIFIGLMFVCLTVCTAFAQTTAFSYQGRLNDAGNPANANYEMEFRLFDALAGGDQIGATFTDANVTVINGFFSTELDFGAAAFAGAARWLEVSVRPVGGGAFTILPPRIAILSAPYAIQARNATTADTATNAEQLGGVPANEYVTTTTGATNYIQNGATPQAAANFNIAGNGVIGGDLTVTGTLNANITGNFIQNRTTLQPASDFNISGNGYIGGNVGIGTTAPSSKLTIQGNGYGLTHTNGAVNISSFISSAAGGSAQFGTRSNHPLNFFTNDGLPQLTLNPGGQAEFNTGGSSGFITLGRPNGETGVTINGNGTTRADIRYDGSTLKLLTSAAGIPQATNGIVINQLGNVGIGNANPTTKLFVEGGIYDGLRAIGAGNGVFGQSTGGGNGVTGFSNTSSPTSAAVAAFNTGGGNAIYAAGDTFTTGNVKQSRATNGVVKAMLYVDPFLPAAQYIVRCYNGITGVSTGNCGFTVTRSAAGFYEVNLGFQVSDRFVSINPMGGLVDNFFLGGNNIDFRVINLSGSSVDRAFMLFVY